MNELLEYYLLFQDHCRGVEIFEYDISDYGCDFYSFVKKAKASKLVLKK